MQYAETLREISSLAWHYDLCFRREGHALRVLGLSRVLQQTEHSIGRAKLVAS